METLPKKTEKPWGYELLWAKSDKYAGKVLFIKGGHCLSLQYHRYKDETIYVLHGQIELEIEEEGKMAKMKLENGKSIRIKPNIKHRFRAINDCELLEVSTPELDDVVRLEDKYGRV